MRRNNTASTLKSTSLDECGRPCMRKPCKEQEHLRVVLWHGQAEI